MGKTVIILLNWNGADDTLACLSSLTKARRLIYVVVADNGSTDDSVERIEKFLSESPLEASLLQLGKNWGFAEGNNRAIEFAIARYNPDSFMLLNNDTEVEPDFIEKLREYSDAHPECVALSPRIDYWSEKGRIWFCGGELTFGSRRNIHKDLVKDRNFSAPFAISFISGCGLYFKSSLVSDGGRLLTDKFFFGEEDYEFSLRMKKEKRKMACVPQSVVYHKVGSAAKRAACNDRIMGRDYMYYIGRLIAARGYYCRPVFELILLLTCHNARKVFSTYGLSHRDLSLLMKRLRSDAREKAGISHEDFYSMIVRRSYFDSIFFDNE